MVELLKYLRGYLRIRVSGFSPERFMNLCSNKGILLWNIVREGDAYCMFINLRGFFELRPIVRKTGTRVAVLERYGLPFFVPKLVRRKVFVAGLVLTLAFWFLSSNYIWDIQVSGNIQITDDLFKSFLKEHQVNVGMRREALDIEELEKEIRRQFPQITWASAKLTGIRLQIDVKENDAPIHIEEKEVSRGTDLVAEYEGRIVSIIVRSGVPKVAIGDAVEKGAVLVEGKIPIYNEDATVREYRYVDADADIVMEHGADYSEELPFDYVIKEYTGREKREYYLKVGGKDVKLPGDRPFQVYDSIIRESRPAVLEKLGIPLFWGNVTHREYLNVEHTYTVEEARALLNQKLREFLASLDEKGVQIIEKNVRIDTNENSWTLRGEFLVQESAGVRRDTERDPGEETSDTDSGEEGGNGKRDVQE